MQPGPTPQTCTVDGCDRPHYARDWCSRHYDRWYKRGGDPAISLLPTLGNKRYVTKAGYVDVRALGHPMANQNGYVKEHRLVMAEHLGRMLLPEENVHHINGDRQDNRIENLEVWNTSQPSGQRAEDKIAFAVEILRLYRPELLAEEPTA